MMSTPLVRLAERAGLPALVEEHLDLGATVNSAGANPVAKVLSVVAGMAAGADSIEDLDQLRHGAMDRVFHGIRAPSTLGTFLRCFTFGHIRQLHRIHRRFLASLTTYADLLPGADRLAFVDIDPTHLRVYGRAKQGAQYGRFKGIRTLHPILSTIGTPGSAPVIGPVRLRRGKAADVRGAASFVAESIATAREAGCTGTLVVPARIARRSRRVVLHLSAGWAWAPAWTRLFLRSPRPATPGDQPLTHDPTRARPGHAWKSRCRPADAPRSDAHITVDHPTM